MNLPAVRNKLTEIEADHAVYSALRAYPREPLPAGFVTRVMAGVADSPRRGWTLQPARPALVDIGVAAGVAMFALLLVGGSAWLTALEPTLLPRAAHLADQAWAAVLPGVPRPTAGATSLGAILAGLAALAAAVAGERLRPLARVG